MARLAVALVLLALAALAAAASAAAPAGEDGVRCSAPQPVCAVRGRVFPVASFDPVGSAVLLEPGLLVTNRHVVADYSWATVFLPDGSAVQAVVLPSAYPGDLVLLRAPVTLGGIAPIETATVVEGDAPLYAVTADVAAGEARVYPPGEVILPPDAGRPLARLHHSAASEPGNGGGALVDERGRLVAVIASGGEEGRNEAIPAGELASLRALSGLGYVVESQRLGSAYRRCFEALERGRTGRGPVLDTLLADEIVKSCAETGNRQLYDMAGRLLGLSGRIADAVAMFEASLDQDPNALNAMVGRAIALNLGLRFGEALPQLRRLVDLLPDDAEVLRLAAQAGAWAGDPELAKRAHALLGSQTAARAKDDAPPLRQLLGAGMDPLLGRPKG